MFTSCLSSTLNLWAKKLQTVTVRRTPYPEEIHTAIRGSAYKDFVDMRARTREQLLINERGRRHFPKIKDMDLGRSIECCLDLLGLIRIILQNHWCLSNKVRIEFQFE